MTTIKVHFEPPRGSDGRVDPRGHGINWLGATRTEWKVADLGGGYALHVRADLRNGAKAFLWEHPDGRHGRNREISGTDRVYGLVLVNGQRKGLLVEGEKSADAARAALPASWLVCATVCGAYATPEADVLDRLAHVPSWTLWGDADANGAGQEHMRQIAWYLKRRCQVHMVLWHKAPPGGDVADFLRDHSRAELIALLKDAVLVK